MEKEDGRVGGFIGQERLSEGGGGNRERMENKDGGEARFHRCHTEPTGFSQHKKLRSQPIQPALVSFCRLSVWIFFLFPIIGHLSPLGHPC